MGTHSGSKLVPHGPNLLRTIRRIQQDVQTLRTRTRPDSVTFIAYDPSYGVPVPATTPGRLHRALVARSGDTLYVDVIAYTGTSSVLKFNFECPDLSITTSQVSTVSSPNSEQLVRLTFAFPDAWLTGDAHLLYIEGVKASGPSGDLPTMSVIRAVQR